jgi:hypothetical protein
MSFKIFIISPFIDTLLWNEALFQSQPGYQSYIAWPISPGLYRLEISILCANGYEIDNLLIWQWISALSRAWRHGVGPAVLRFAM